MNRPTPRRAPYTLLALALAGLALAGLGLAGLTTPAAAQELSGLAVGPDGEALAGTAVVLHRVGGGGGGFVATDTTADDGTFRFFLEAADSAIYFAALRHEGRMYIGPAVQGGAESVSGYMLRVEPGSEAGAVAGALSGGSGVRPPTAMPTRAGRPGGAGTSDTGALFLVALLAAAAVMAFLVAAPRYRRRQTRVALTELARAENALAAGGATGEERAALEAARDRLRRQLGPRS